MGRRARRLLEGALLTTPKAGDWVTWSASRGLAVGKVASVHTASHVPGIPHKLDGSVERPALRVRLMSKVKGGYTPTNTFVGRYSSDVSGLDTQTEIAEEAPVAEAVIAGSFDDIRMIVQDALEDRIGALTGVDDAEVYVADMGMTWVVYSVNWGNDLLLCDYSLDANGVVTLGDPIEVDRVTSYVADVDPVDAATGATLTEARQDRIAGRLLGAVGVDETGGRIFRVQIISVGDSKNGRRYSESVLRKALPLYEGAKAYDHHRTDAELNSSTIQGLVGMYRNVEATTGGLEGDLHLLPSATHTAEALDAALTAPAQSAPFVGISHDVMALYKPITVGNRRLQEATEITSVNSADVVAQPAAGGRAIRMVAGGPDSNPQGVTVNLKQLLALLRAASTADRAGLLVEHAQILEAAGLSTDEAIRLAEAAPAPPPVPVPVAAPSVQHSREGIFGRLAIREAARAATLPDALLENLMASLPEQFTEAELTAEIERVKHLAEAMERAGMRPRVEHVDVTADVLDKKRTALDEMLDPTKPGGYRSIKEAYLDWTGRQVPYWDATENARLFRDTITVRSEEGDRSFYDSEQRSTESMTSSSWGLALGDSVTRRLIAAYTVPNLMQWQQIVSSVFDVADFRTQRIDRVGGYGNLPAVAQGAPYNPLTSPSNEEITYAVSKVGGTEDWTLEMAANDDLRALQRIPTNLGVAAANTLFQFVMQFIQANPTLYDSTALFAAGHNNTDTNVLSNTNVNVGRRKLLKQTAYGASQQFLAAPPRFLLVPTTLEALAWELVTSTVALPTAAPDGAASNIPNIHQGLGLIRVDYWDASSATQWYLVGDPAVVPTIEIGFYGSRDPQLFLQADPTVGSMFNADKVTFKIRHIYGGNVLDFRGFYRGNT